MVNLNFIKTVIKDYRVGAITVSSEYVVRKIVQELNPTDKYIVEYGAGDGVLTKEILKFLPADGRLVAFELNKDLLEELKQIKDSRLTILSDDVVEASKDLKRLRLPRIDAVVSGIPFTLLSSGSREKIVRHTFESLNEGGIFLVYQYTPMLFPLLKKFFKNIDLSFEPRNFLPYFIMKAKK